MIPLKDENPTRTTPFVTIGIIALNFAVFLYLLVLGPEELKSFIYQYSVIPERLIGEHGAALLDGFPTLITSMFLHGGVMHIAGNMLFLWVFGDNVEDVLGHVRYVFFYLACGIAAAFAHALSVPDSAMPMLGASGAISGVLGAYMVLFPRARVWTFFFFIIYWQVIRVPAVFIIGLWILIQVLNGMTEFGKATGGVAWLAHVGGFAAGIILILVMKKRSY